MTRNVFMGSSSLPVSFAHSAKHGLEKSTLRRPEFELKANRTGVMPARTAAGTEGARVYMKINLGDNGSLRVVGSRHEARGIGRKKVSRRLSDEVSLAIHDEKLKDACAMLLMIDNYDSFTYNLVQYFGELGEDVKVIRNDEIDLAGIAALKPDHIVVSPGPCTPNEAGVSVPLIREFAGRIPILGVCLGHQSIGQAFGGRIVRAKELMHGKTSMIHHLDVGVFKGLPNPFRATRYHSLVIERESLPDCLEITAWTDDGEIMGVRHKTLAVEGVQFHPESILTEHGHAMLENFLKGTR
jgi:anthranilate synthase component 2